MADVFDSQKRSWIMARVKNRNSKPEQIVRAVLLELGIRYRLKAKYLPCKPDFIFPGRKKVIFVNGCFWHGHIGCKRAKIPATNTEFWEAKIQRNISRDAENQTKLKELGWESLVIWQCSLKDKELLKVKLEAFLNA